MNVVRGELQLAAEAVAQAAMARGFTVSTAESCTGGRIAAAITAFGGSSMYYPGGVVAYANRIKRDILGVGQDLLDAHGAVSEPVARSMAEGVRGLFGTDVAVAVTGIAGPSGGTAAKPVGMVWFGVATASGTMVHCCEFAGDRDAVQVQATRTALKLLASAITNES